MIELTGEQGRLSPDWTARQIAEPDGAGTTFVIEVDGRKAGRLRVVRTNEQIIESRLTR